MFFKKVNGGIANGDGWPLMELKDSKKYFNAKEIAFIENILNLCPGDFGLNCDSFEIDRKIYQNKFDSMVAIDNQKYYLENREKILKKQFLPKNVFKRFCEMNEAMECDIGRRLNVYSGYRSPVYQALVFFHVLYLNKWNVKKTLKRVAIPRCSEHCNAERQGIDFAPVRGISKLKNFFKTKEYKWLCKKAEKFGFFLSYGKNNKQGFIFEPWHWCFRK